MPHFITEEAVGFEQLSNSSGEFIKRLIALPPYLATIHRLTISAPSTIQRTGDYQPFPLIVDFDTIKFSVCLFSNWLLSPYLRTTKKITRKPSVRLQATIKLVRRVYHTTYCFTPLVTETHPTFLPNFITSPSLTHKWQLDRGTNFRAPTNASVSGLSKSKTSADNNTIVLQTIDLAFSKSTKASGEAIIAITHSSLLFQRINTTDDIDLVVVKRFSLHLDRFPT
ncbi:hypothetical protein PGTUg99_017333 [Puccinia graminis f. sp. tritici]|uniref:Uncharacterized protein n=1 Tax=Puccinia graminis f. sp. tritici TaxID=56615 RepID=A0A5B0Q0Z4_PUCGR|nr:hypothetical protein PGTUg99_017333 [Puccinia graminis f. sp. tritici]